MTVTDEINKLAITKSAFKTLLKKIYGENEDLGNFQNYTELFKKIVDFIICGWGNCEENIFLELPAIIDEIPNGLFSEKKTITGISGKITKVGNNAFYMCENLESFPFDNLLTYIGESAFLGTKLTEVNLNSRSTIKRDAFAGCKSLVKFYAPYQLTIPNIFFNCENLSNFQAPRARTIESLAFAYLHLTAQNEFYGSMWTLYLPYVTSIGVRAFYESIIDGNINLQNIEQLQTSIFENSTINGEMFLLSIKSIENSTFKNCNINGKIIIESTIETINATAFDNCTGDFEIHINKPTGSITGAPWGATTAKVVWNSTGE